MASPLFVDQTLLSGSVYEARVLMTGCYNGRPGHKYGACPFSQYRPDTKSHVHAADR